MKWVQKTAQAISKTFCDENFLYAIEQVKEWIAKILSLVMVAVILMATVDLIFILSQELFVEPGKLLSEALFGIFALFLEVLIALEILDNISAYLKNHQVQMELVIATSLVAVARKIIIFDFGKAGGIELISLAIASLTLAISYWIIRRINHKE